MIIIETVVVMTKPIFNLSPLVYGKREHSQGFYFLVKSMGSLPLSFLYRFSRDGNSR